MKKEYLSQKEIAAELKVTKQQVYRCIKKHHINEAHQEVVNGNTVLMYDKVAVKRIKEIFETSSTTSKKKKEVHQEVHQEAHTEVLYEAIVKQLEEKDKQIAELQKLLDQSQKLHAMDKQRILELEDKAAAEEPKKRRWKIFG